MNTSIRRLSFDGFTKEQFNNLRESLSEIEQVVRIRKMSVAYGSCYFEFKPNGFVSYVSTQIKQLDTLLQEIF